MPSIAGAMAAAWLGFFHQLSKRPELTDGERGAAFFGRERRRAWLGDLLPTASPPASA